MIFDANNPRWEKVTTTVEGEVVYKRLRDGAYFRSIRGHVGWERMLPLVQL